MKILSFCTPSHNRLYEEYFKPSFLKLYPKDDFIHHEHKTQYSNGSYMSEGWVLTQLNKVSFVRDYMNSAEENTKFIFSDVDIIACNEFKSEISTILDTYNACFQPSHSRQYYRVFNIPDRKKERAGICSGFYAMKVNAETKKFINNVANALKRGLKNPAGDQYFFNGYKHELTFTCLSDMYVNPGILTKGLGYNNTYEEILKAFIDDHKEDLKIFHANFTPTLAQKEKLIHMVYDRISK